MTDHVEMDRPKDEEWPSLKKDAEEMLELRIAASERGLGNAINLLGATIDRVAALEREMEMLECQDCERGTFTQLYIKDEIAKIDKKMEIFLREMRGAEH